MNDLIFTPAGGAVIGEATYRLGRMFAAGIPSMGNCMGALLFSPVATLNETRVCRTGYNQPTDEFGLPARTWHYLAFNLGQAYFSFDGGAVGTAVDLGFGVAIVDHRGYRQPGTGLSPVSPGEWTELAWENLISHGGLRGLRLHAGGAWWGRYYRNYAVADENAPRKADGWGSTLGLGNTLDFDSRVLPLEGIEWSRPGSSAHARVCQPAWRPHHAGDAGCPVRLLDGDVARLPGRRRRLRQHREDRAHQARILLRAERHRRRHGLPQRRADRGVPAGAGRRLLVDNSGDRNQGQLTDNFSLRDQRIYLRAAATLRILGGPLRAALAFD